MCFVRVSKGGEKVAEHCTEGVAVQHVKSSIIPENYSEVRLWPLVSGTKINRATISQFSWN